MIQNYTYKFRIYPNNTQKELLEKTFGCVRFIYNYYLAKKSKIYKESKGNLSKVDCNNHCNKELKIQFSWLKDIDKFAITNAVYNLDNAYKHFFRRVRNGEKEVGYPKFKSKHSNNNSYKTNFTNNNIKILEKHIQLPKLGKIKLAKSQEVEGMIKSCTVKKTKSGNYYVAVLVEKEIQELPRNNNKIGIDLGIKTFATIFDGGAYQEVSSPNFYRKEENKLKRLTRNLHKKQKGGTNRNKARILLAKASEKVANKRNDFLQKLSTKLVTENQIINLEDLNISGMLRNHKLAKSISDCSWSEFVRQIEYKAGWYGREVKKVDRFYASSKICSDCGEKNTLLELKDRNWVCSSCGSIHDRDRNASVNIYRVGTTRINACGDNSSTDCVNFQQELSMKQESPALMQG
jgi:putative transposase